jgi:predicted RNase H-like nuclease
LKRGVIVEDNHYFIYTHDETGLEREFEITNIDNFLATQEEMPTLIKELEREVAFLEKAVFNNMRTIKKAREFLGWSPEPEPEIRDSIFRTEFLKSKAEMN